MVVVEIERVKEAMRAIDIVPAIEAGFALYSAGRAVVPAVGELLFEDPPGEVHIKYGYLEGDAYYVIKVASGFYENPKRNLPLPSGDGLMLLFSRETGELMSILLDRGYLTDLRTAAAGAVAAKYLAPQRVRRIGIVGTGTQARLQLQYLAQVTECRRVIAWGRSPEKLACYRAEMERHGFSIEMTQDSSVLAASCNLIVTATASRSPLLWGDQIRRGTHITAVGADTPEKQELDPAILAKADLVVADSVSQCVERGDIAHAVRAQAIDVDDIVELGQVVSGKVPGRTSEDQITVADLTGVAVQDIQIAKAVYESVCRGHPHGVPAGERA